MVCSQATTLWWVGNPRAVLGNHRGGATARQPHRRIAHLVEPCLIGCEAVAGLYLARGEMIERPHALIGMGCLGSANRDTQHEGDDWIAWHALGLLSLVFVMG